MLHNSSGPPKILRSVTLAVLPVKRPPRRRSIDPVPTAARRGRSSDAKNSKGIGYRLGLTWRPRDHRNHVSGLDEVRSGGRGDRGLDDVVEMAFFVHNQR